MTKKDAGKYRAQLQTLAEQVRGTANSAEEMARTSTGGEAAGNLSNAPMHLGDVGSEVFNQEIGATILENEQYLQSEILAALDRIDAGTFGKCENCEKTISKERLDAVPYTRFCIACAQAVQAGNPVNVNIGRPDNWQSLISTPSTRRDQTSDEDPNAVGTPGGGSAVGGLAGTNIGSGSPDNANLENAMGSSLFDQEIAGDQEEEAYSGPTGGAVGGTPANKRATGGKMGAGEPAPR